MTWGAIEIGSSIANRSATPSTNTTTRKPPGEEALSSARRGHRSGTSRRAHDRSSKFVCPGAPSEMKADESRLFCFEVAALRLVGAAPRE